MAITTPTNIDYIIEGLRLHLGDIDPTAYRYLDEWLRTALIGAVEELERWWNYKYLVNETTYQVYRNTQLLSFTMDEPPVIEQFDKKPIILMASYMIKGGSLENSSWTFGSWRDAEISYSNIEGSRAKKDSRQADWDELVSILKPPQKILAGSQKNSLPGYKKNPWEY